MKSRTTMGWRSWQVTKLTLSAVLTLGLTMFAVNDSNAQCNNGAAFGTYTSNNSGTPQTLSTCHFLTEYSTINGVIAGATYELTITNGGAGTNGYVTVREGSPGGAVVAFGPSPLTFTNGAATTIYAHWNIDAACATASKTNITARLPNL